VSPWVSSCAPDDVLRPRHILTCAVEAGVIESNPAHGIREPKDDVRKRRLSEAEYRILDVASDDAAAAVAVELARTGKAEGIMKGHLHPDALLHHVVKHDSGLRTSRRLSHVFVMDVPGLDQMLIVPDAA
jgi:phosphotransacetylase